MDLKESNEGEMGGAKSRKEKEEIFILQSSMFYKNKVRNKQSKKTNMFD